MTGAAGPVAGPLAPSSTSPNPQAGHLPGPIVAATVSATPTRPAPARHSAVRLRAVSSRLSSRDLTILRDLARLRLLPASALDVLHFADITAPARSRVRRRVMRRLAALGLAATLDRRVGGVHAGSAGLVHTLTEPGHRLLALQDTRSRPRVRRAPEPGAAFTTHTLAVVELYADLVGDGRACGFTVPVFDTEPDCWLPAGHGRWLRPDAYTVLDNGRHRDVWCVEVDRATESLPRLRRKILDYARFLAGGGVGPDDVPPRVLWTAPDQRRADAIRRVISTLPVTDRGWFAVATHETAIRFLSTELTAE